MPRVFELPSDPSFSANPPLQEDRGAWHHGELASRDLQALDPGPGLLKEPRWGVGAINEKRLK